jgi:hypothetical protein
VGLSFRVRNGTGRFPHAMTAVTLLPGTHRWCVWEIWCYNCGVVIQLWCCSLQQNRVTGLLVGNHIVDASSLVFFFTIPGRKPLLNRFTRMVCGVSYRPISTGQLHESLVLASTSGLSTQWSGWGPLTHKVYGNLISKRASRLDAFSGYPIRT